MATTGGKRVIQVAAISGLAAFLLGYILLTREDTRIAGLTLALMGAVMLVAAGALAMRRPLPKGQALPRKIKAGLDPSDAMTEGSRRAPAVLAVAPGRGPATNAVAKGAMGLAGGFLAFIGLFVIVVGIALQSLENDTPDGTGSLPLAAILGLLIGGGLIVAGVRLMGPATRGLVETERE